MKLGVNINTSHTYAMPVLQPIRQLQKHNINTVLAISGHRDTIHTFTITYSYTTTSIQIYLATTQLHTVSIQVITIITTSSSTQS